MTNIELTHRFLMKANQLDSRVAENMKTYEILAKLTEAQDQLVSLLYNQGNISLLGEIEDTTKITSTSFSAYDPGVTNANVVDMSGSLTRYMFYLRSQSVITRTTAPEILANAKVKNDDILYSDIRYYESNGTNKPLYTFPKAVVEKDSLIVLPDAYTTISDIYVTYIRRPKELVYTVADASSQATSSELRDSLHEDIVNLAISNTFGKSEEKEDKE